jgi:hypothetical protein
VKAESHSLPTEHSTLKSQLTLTLLGTGTSQGVPMIRCDCEARRSDLLNPRQKIAASWLQSWVKPFSTHMAEENYIVGAQDSSMRRDLDSQLADRLGTQTIYQIMHRKGRARRISEMSLLG